MTETFVPPKTDEEALSRKEQFLDSGFDEFSMQLLELEIFGSVSEKTNDRQTT